MLIRFSGSSKGTFYLDLGRNATYDTYHRDRLLVIKKLRSFRCSIEDIREQFRHAGPDEEIRISVVPLPDPSVDTPPTEDNDSALGFIRERQQAMAPIRDMQSPAGEPVVRQQRAPSSSSRGPIEQLLEQLRSLSGQRRVGRRTRGEQWVRFAATPDIEIHVRGQLPDDQRKLFEQIADQIRHILLGGKQNA